MGYHHLALAAKNMSAIHDFYEGVMGFELVKVEIGPVREGGWGKHFFYRMDGDDSKFVAFWELHDTPGKDEGYEFDINAAAGLPQGVNHISFSVESLEELNARRSQWNRAGYDVLEVDHNWCRSIYTRDPNGNAVEFCLTTGKFTPEDRAHALAALDMEDFQPTPAPATMQVHPASKPAMV